MALGACSGSHEPSHERPPAAAGGPRKAVGLSVPRLLTLSIDEMAQRVGPRLPLPAGFVDPVALPPTSPAPALDSVALFRCRGLALVTTYDLETRRVSDILLLGNDENDLMSRAQLQLGAEQYLVLPVFQAHRPTQLLGLRVLAIAVN